MHNSYEVLEVELVVCVEVLLNTPKDPNKTKYGNYEENSMEFHLEFKKPKMKNVEVAVDIYSKELSISKEKVRFSRERARANKAIAKAFGSS